MVHPLVRKILDPLLLCYAGELKCRRKSCPLLPLPEVNSYAPNVALRLLIQLVFKVFFKWQAENAVERKEG